MGFGLRRQNREKGSVFACSGGRGLWARGPSPACQTCSRLLVSLQLPPTTRAPYPPRVLGVWLHPLCIASQWPLQNQPDPDSRRHAHPHSTPSIVAQTGDWSPELWAGFGNLRMKSAKSGRRGNRTKGLADPAKDREGTLAMKR